MTGKVLSNIKRNNNTPSDLHTIRTHLRNCPLFESASNQLIDDFAAQAQLISCPAHSVLFMAEGPASRFYIVISGWIKLFKETLDGQDVVIDLAGAGQIIGEMALYNGGLTTSSAEAVESAVLISLPLNLLARALEENHALALSMLKTLAKDKRILNQEIEHLSTQTAAQRIGCFILRLVKGTASGPLHVNLPYDKALIAARLGMKPETFSRALARLREETGLKINGAKIELSDISILSEYCCIGCSSEFPCKE